MKNIKIMAAILTISILAPATTIQGTQQGQVNDSTPVVTSEPIITPAPTATPAPTVKKINKVTGVKLYRYSTTAVKVTWKRIKKAKWYRIYTTDKKNGTYKLAGKTKNLHYLVKGLKKKTTHYFYVQACVVKKESPEDSLPSKVCSMKMKKYTRRTIFAGDSITEGIKYGHLHEFKVGGAKSVVAAIGLNTTTFHTKRVFGGRTGLQKIMTQKPYRVYIMLGMNEIHFISKNSMINEYRDMIGAIQSSSPNTQIVLCGISPVTKARTNRSVGFRAIPSFNKKLKALAKKMGTEYYGDWNFILDSQGYLKTQYASADGCHWKHSVYTMFAKKITKFNNQLDKN